MKLPYKFGKYVLLEEIAQGGTAVVYRGKYLGECGFAKEVAVKRILSSWVSNKEFETMLIDEAKALVHLQHQNIVQVYELGKDEDIYYISMEYVDGIDLRFLYNSALKIKEEIPEKFACFIIVEILKGLEFAHSKMMNEQKSLNIVHRDISPQNILLSMNGEVKIADFGIAKGSHREEETSVVKLKGKYAYMSPEQASVQELDQRTDLFSVGIVFFELLTGMRLFKSTTEFDTLSNVRESRMPNGWEIFLSLDMRNILKKALARERKARYQSATQFLDDLRNYIAFKKLTTHEQELAKYISDKIPKRNRNIIQNKNPKKTKIITNIGLVNRPQSHQKYLNKKFIGGSLMLCFLVVISMMAFYGYRNKSDVTLSVNSEIEKGLVVPEKRLEIRRPALEIGDKGFLEIESIPSNADVILSINGESKNFTTPFVFPNIDLSKDVSVHVSIFKQGYENALEEISLSKEHSNYKKKFQLIPKDDGRLSVQVRPWGYIYMNGVLNKSESPINKVKVKPGKHELKIHFEPENKWANIDVNIMPGVNHKCFADFTKGNRIWCE